MQDVNWYRAVGAGVCGGLAWIAGMYLFFFNSVTQGFLSNQDLQSAKFLAVFTQIEPLPKMNESIYVLYLGLLGLGLIYGLVYCIIEAGLPGKGIKRGMSFGAVAWALSFPWFEFYLPWNVMHEPFALVLIELLAWFGVMQFVGIVIALVYRSREQ